MILSKLKNTGDCIKYGKTLTDDQKDELTHCRAICMESSEKWLDADCFGIASIMAAKSQFCREAIEVSEGKLNY